MPWQAAPPRKIELARGDKIVVISGDFDGLTGTVDRALGDEIMVIIDPHLRAEGIPEEFLFNIHDLMKRFDIGDSVVVSRGTDFGNSGIVVGIGDFRAAFLRSARAYTLMSPTDSASRILTITHGTRSFKSRTEDCKLSNRGPMAVVIFSPSITSNRGLKVVWASKKKKIRRGGKKRRGRKKEKSRCSAILPPERRRVTFLL
jgi:hypothetical protein